MSDNPHPSNAPSADMPSTSPAGHWLDGARALQRAASVGQARPLLRGKNLGLLCEDDTLADACLFRESAQALGALVAHIRPSLSLLATPQELQHTARLLGRLYDAVECQGLPADVVQQIGAAAGVPVYDGLATAAHPSARLAGLLDGGVSADEQRRLLLQAVLLQSIG